MPKPKRCALNIISGQLGAGKTTLLRHLLRHKPDNEHWALLVNEFGAVGIDGAILQSASQTHVTEIPGGCICCTAKSELESRVIELLDTVKPDRILIEPTGLGEPDTLVDLFTQNTLENRLEIQTLFSVIDLQQMDLAEYQRLTVLQSLLNMADVLILNKKDRVSEATIHTVRNYCEQLYPPKKAIYITESADIPIESLMHPHLHTTQFRPSGQHFNAFTLGKSPHAHSAAQAKTASFSESEADWPHLLKHLQQTQLDTNAVGWVFSHEAVFDWKCLFALLESLGQGHFQDTPNSIKRAKGVFRVGTSPRMLFQWVNGHATRELIAYRKDSRFELLLSLEPFDLPAFESALKACQKT